jgi:hypothetical protein
VIHRSTRAVARRSTWKLAILTAGAFGAAATTLVVPTALAGAAGPATQCWGSLKSAPTASDAHALDYKFNCNWGITAYSIVATRQPSDYSTIDDFDPDGLAYDQATGSPAPGIDFDCAGVLPGNGINCGLSSGYAPAPDFIEGWVDTSDPYCSYVPKGAKNPAPQAIVQLIVTDTNGVEDGPFRLGLQPGCGTAPKTKTKSKSKQTAKRERRRK